MTSQYDLVFLTNDQAQLDRIKQLIASLDGKVNAEKSLGTKTFAYPINKLSSASYYEWSLEMPTTSMAEFKKKLGFEDKLIRYLLLGKED